MLKIHIANLHNLRQLDFKKPPSKWFSSFITSGNPSFWLAWSVTIFSTIVESCPPQPRFFFIFCKWVYSTAHKFPGLCYGWQLLQVYHPTFNFSKHKIDNTLNTCFFCKCEFYFSVVKAQEKCHYYYVEFIKHFKFTNGFIFIISL